MPREKVLAAVVALLEATMIRVGNEEYARDNDSHGLTTMNENDVRVRGDAIRFRFRGKKTVVQDGYASSAEGRLGNNRAGSGPPLQHPQMSHRAHPDQWVKRAEHVNEAD